MRLARVYYSEPINDSDDAVYNRAKKKVRRRGILMGALLGGLGGLAMGLFKGQPLKGALVGALSGAASKAVWEGISSSHYSDRTVSAIKKEMAEREKRKAAVFINQKAFSDKKKKEDPDSKLENYKSSKGIKSGLLTAATIPLLSKGYKGKERLVLVPAAASPLIGRAIGNSVATEADQNGKSDKEILRKARISGALSGAGFGALGGALAGSTHNKTLAKAIVGSVLGGVGGYIGANRSVKDRLERRARYVDRD